MPLVWVTGSPGVGKSTVCALLKERGMQAVDCDTEGFSSWVDRTSGDIVTPEYPLPNGWFERFAWRISRTKVEALKGLEGEQTIFLCGSIENEVEVRDLFDLVFCLVADDETLRDRLETRTGNVFGKHPQELAAAISWNDGIESRYRRLGATIIDGRMPSRVVVDAVLAAAEG